MGRSDVNVSPMITDILTEGVDEANPGGGEINRICNKLGGSDSVTVPLKSDMEKLGCGTKRRKIPEETWDTLSIKVVQNLPLAINGVCVYEMPRVKGKFKIYQKTAGNGVKP